MKPLSASPIKWTFRRNEYDLWQERLSAAWRFRSRSLSGAKIVRGEHVSARRALGDFAATLPCDCGRMHHETLELERFDLPLRRQLAEGIESDPCYGAISFWCRLASSWAKERCHGRARADAYRLWLFPPVMCLSVLVAISEWRSEDGEADVAAAEAECIRWYWSRIKESLNRCVRAEPDATLSALLAGTKVVDAAIGQIIKPYPHT